MSQISDSDPKKLPANKAETPNHLYTPEFKRYDAANIIIFNKIDDHNIIEKWVRLTAKPINSVQLAIPKTAAALLKAHATPAPNGAGSGGEAEAPEQKMATRQQPPRLR